MEKSKRTLDSQDNDHVVGSSNRKRGQANAASVGTSNDRASSDINDGGAIPRAKRKREVLIE